MKATYKVKITKLTPDPLHKGRILVHLLVSQGKESWVRQVSFIRPDRPVSAEEFVQSLKYHMISRPQDPLQYLNEAIEFGNEFDLEIKEENA